MTSSKNVSLERNLNLTHGSICTREKARRKMCSKSIYYRTTRPQLSTLHIIAQITVTMRFPEIHTSFEKLKELSSLLEYPYKRIARISATNSII